MAQETREEYYFSDEFASEHVSEFHAYLNAGKGTERKGCIFARSTPIGEPSAKCHLLPCGEVETVENVPH